MLAPKLRHRITIQSVAESQNPVTGEITKAWADFLADEPAEVVPLSGREFLQSSATQSNIDSRIAIRWRPGIDTKMRVLFNSVYYDIRAVLPDPSNARWLTLMCQSLTNQGS